MFIGDYLFDGRSFDSVFFITVYEEEGKLYAYSEMTDYPVEMERTNIAPPVFRIKYKRKGDFSLSFSRLAGKRYNSVLMSDNKSEFKMEGERSSEEILKLREYHNGRGGKYSYRKPLQLADGLKTGSVSDTEIDTTALYAMIDGIIDSSDIMHSLLVIKNGKLVVEEYFNGWDPPRLHRLQSVTKSYTSTLVGLALKHGYIGSVDDPVHKYLPQYDSLFTDEKKMITIEHLLTMSAGFEWNEEATYYNDPKACDAHIAGASRDFIEYVLSKPLASLPGERYEYNSGFPNMMGHIVCERSGMKILDFSLKYLFGPLGMNRARWMRNYNNKEYRPGCAGGLKLTSRDMAKYGLLYLQGGLWNGEQILDPDWVRESVEGKIDSGYDTHYGYFWKSIFSPDGKHEIFFASGTGGQFIVCIPGLDAVVVTAAVFNTDRSDEIVMMLQQQMIPALEGS